MILRRLATAFRKQDWFTVAVETLIVVFGVFIGLQVNNWNAASQDRAREAVILEQLTSEFSMAVGEGQRAQVEAEASLVATRDVLKAIRHGQEPDDS
jgi:hypothetical protein